MTDPIPLDVLATWLAPEALARIDRFWSPERRADQCDAELAAVGLVADWTVYAEGPVLSAIRVKDAGVE